MSTPSGASQSVLEPIAVGLHVDSPRINLGSLVALQSLRSRVPVEIVDLHVRMQGQRQVMVIPHRRLLAVSAPGGKLAVKTEPGYLRLCDVHGEEDDLDGWGRWRWEISWTWHADGAEVGLTTPHAITLAVEQYRLIGGKIDCAAQLALVRHLFVDGLLAIDEHAEVIGRHDWDDAWWQLESRVASA